MAAFTPCVINLVRKLANEFIKGERDSAAILFDCAYIHPFVFHGTGTVLTSDDSENRKISFQTVIIQLCIFCSKSGMNNISEKS